MFCLLWEENGGGSQEAGEPRDVDFHEKLENHLEAMFEHRNRDSDWMFPSHRIDGPMRDFRKQLTRVKRATETTDLGFHHFRHYFISHAVMAGVDFATIALWVGHRDGGVLIGKVYGHLSREHPTRMARKLDNAF